MSIGFTLPFAKSTGSIGYLESTQDELAAVRENLKSLLITNWGERVMHWNFGCNLIEFLFDQSGSNEIKSKIADRILSQISMWMPFISIEQLNIVFQEEDSNLNDHTMGIRIKFKLNQRPDLTAILDFQISP